MTAFAWAVHLYTASGAALGMLAIHYAARAEVRAAFAAMGVATIVDATDGPLARWLRVRDRAPALDGTMLDNVVDYLTYVVAPLFLMLRMAILPARWPGLAVAIFAAMASAYGFCRVDAKTEDGYFRGFPSYWNLVALYLFCLKLPAGLNAAVVAALSAMVAMPLKFIYPNRTGPLRKLTLTLSVAWAAVTLGVVAELPACSSTLLYPSLAYVGYYLATSFALQVREKFGRWRLAT